MLGFRMNAAEVQCLAGTSRVISPMAMLAALGCFMSFGQEPQSIGTPATGTLNLLLANNRGFVIAADSRRTRLAPLAHWDDSQKLFRVGPKSAMVIAGFASWASQGSPLDVQVAAVLRDEFTESDWTSGRRSVTDLQATIGTRVGYQLKLFGALFATAKPSPSPEALDFQTLAAGIGRRGEIRVVRIGFAPRVQQWGPFNIGAPSYEIKSISGIVNHFAGLSAGVDTVARRILDGTVETLDNRILNYYRSRSAGKLDELPLIALEGLAAAILEETKRVSPFVGGPNQLGVFSRKGRCMKWSLQPLPLDRQKLNSTVLNLGITYTPDGRLTPEEYSEARGKNMVTEMNVSLVQPFEQPFTQVFIGARFRDVAVSLDGNAFAGNSFSNVTFKYLGGSVFFANTNSLGPCVVESPPNVQVPGFLRSCVVKQVATPTLERTIGSPLRAEPHGCVTRNAAGRVVVKTQGRQNGQDCRGSSLTVPNLLRQPLRLLPQNDPGVVR
jgi:hypothetical protein